MFASHKGTLSVAQNALIATMLIAALGVSTFFAFEPSVGRAVISSNFTVTQQITSEISFIATTSATMVGSIAGLTGGYATGTALSVVRTNNSTGYSMSLAFSSTTAMKLNGANSTISNYTPAVGGVPDYNWVDNASGGIAEFGYTVRASTTAEVDPSFKNSGAACNTGSTESDDKCWMNPSTTPEVIINSTASNISSTTTLKFKVAVPNNPSPALPSGFYVATGTLTAVTNP